MCALKVTIGSRKTPPSVLKMMHFCSALVSHNSLIPLDPWVLGLRFREWKKYLLINDLVSTFCDRAYNFRWFRELVGLERSWFDKILSGVCNLERNMLMMTLLFMKHYWLGMFGAFILQISQSTLDRWIEKTQSLLLCWAKLQFIDRKSVV